MKPKLTYKHHDAFHVPSKNSDDIHVETAISPILDVNFEDIEDQTMGTEVLQIRVLRNGEYVNYWIRVGTNKSNRVICEVSTNMADQTKSKSLQAGAWRDATSLGY